MNLLRRMIKAKIDPTVLSIGNGGFLIDLPGGLHASESKENTTIVTRPGVRHVVLRFTALIITQKINPSARDLARPILERQSKTVDTPIQEEDGRASLTYSRPAEEGPAADVHYIQVANRSAVLVSSAWVQRSKAGGTEVRELLHVLERAARSFRPNPLYHAAEGVKPVDEPLSAWEQAFLAERRALIERRVREGLGLPGLPSGEAGLPILQRLLDGRIITRRDPAGLEALGVAAGDILAGRAGLEWAAEVEPRGAIPVLRLPGTRAALYATTLAWKRVELGQPVHLPSLLEELAGKMDELRARLPQKVSEHAGD